MVTLDKYSLNNFFSDIKKVPIQVCDLVELMRENYLTEASKVLMQTVEENGFTKNDIIYVDNILKCYTQDTYCMIVTVTKNILKVTEMEHIAIQFHS